MSNKGNNQSFLNQQCIIMHFNGCLVMRQKKRAIDSQSFLVLHSFKSEFVK